MKAQFAIDAFLIVVLAVIALGGVFFLHTFINGLSLESLISIVDQEIDQRCFYSILPLTGGEYVTAGNDVSKNPYFNKTFAYFGGKNKYMDLSFDFEQKMNFYAQRMLLNPFRTNLSYIAGYLASPRKANELRNQILKLKDENFQISTYCFIPIYNPAGEPGSAELFTFTSQKACGLENTPCCERKVQGFFKLATCESGLTCVNNICMDCGEIGEECCPGDYCEEGTCSGGICVM